MKNPPPTVFEIRRAVPSEAPALTALARRSKAYWGYSKEFMRSFEEELTYSGDQVGGSDLTFFVGEANGAMGGFYALSRVLPLEYELEALFVEPELIGQGLGRALLEHATCTVRSLGGESLIVQADPHTEDFYRAGGGERIGTRESGSIPNRFLPLFRIKIWRPGMAH
jgi:GNAT superfamily N-acetyltransferase